MPGARWISLAASVWLRYLESCGEHFEFPSNGYRGEYLLPIARQLRRFRTAPACIARLGSVHGDRSLPPDAPAGGVRTCASTR